MWVMKDLMNFPNILYLIITLILVPSSMLMITILKRRYPQHIENLFLMHGMLSIVSILLSFIALLVSVWSCKEDAHPSNGFFGYMAHHYHLPLLLLSLLANMAICLWKTSPPRTSTSSTHCPFFLLFRNPKAIRSLRRSLSMIIMLFGLISAITILFKEAKQEYSNHKFIILGFILGFELYLTFNVFHSFSLNWREDEENILQDEENEPLII